MCSGSLRSCDPLGSLRSCDPQTHQANSPRARTDWCGFPDRPLRALLIDRGRSDQCLPLRPIDGRRDRELVSAHRRIQRPAHRRRLQHPGFYDSQACSGVISGGHDFWGLLRLRLEPRDQPSRRRPISGGKARGEYGRRRQLKAASTSYTFSQLRAGWRLLAQVPDMQGAAAPQQKRLQRYRPRALGPGAGAIASDQSIQGVNLCSERGTALRRGAHPGARPPLDEALVSAAPNRR